MIGTVADSGALSSRPSSTSTRLRTSAEAVVCRRFTYALSAFDSSSVRRAPTSSVERAPGLRRGVGTRSVRWIACDRSHSQEITGGKSPVATWFSLCSLRGKAQGVALARPQVAHQRADRGVAGARHERSEVAARRVLQRRKRVPQRVRRPALGCGRPAPSTAARSSREDRHRAAARGLPGSTSPSTERRPRVGRGRRAASRRDARRADARRRPGDRRAAGVPLLPRTLTSRRRPQGRSTSAAQAPSRAGQAPRPPRLWSRVRR